MHQGRLLLQNVTSKCAAMPRALTLALLALLAHPSVHAEPYLAVANGLKCAQCHVNPTGGSMRTVFGNVWSQTQLPAHALKLADTPWTGQLGRYLAVGADLRYDFLETVTGTDTTRRGEFADSHVYLGVNVVPDRLLLYADEQVTPGSPQNREAWALFWAADHSWYVKAGEMYLPFGLRLQDQTALVREATGIDMTVPGRGVELGWLKEHWDAQLALSNGPFEPGTRGSGRDVTANLAYVESGWRLGLAADDNQARLGGPRQALGLFGGLKTGPVTWLAEADLVDDRSVPGEPHRLAGLLEADYFPARGQSIKLSAEFLDPDRAATRQQFSRFSAVYELTPVQFVQLRLGARLYAAPAGEPIGRLRFYFIELHGFF